MQTSLRAIAEQARENKKYRFTNLSKLLTKGLLKECFGQLNKKAATGVDGVTYKEYARNLDENLTNLLERVKTQKYRARIVRRHYIKKANGKMRPLGIPVLEDRLLQAAVARILAAIYEEDFTETSYGYRPNRGAKDAVRELTKQVREKISYVVEADIKGFFDHLDHRWLMKMLDLRIGDGSIKKLIWKWLKARALEEGKIILKPVEGTPQGGVISPILANIYLHYALDLWFQEVIKKNSRRQEDAYLIRYADDFVALFRFAEDARSFYKQLGKRLGKFRLELAEEKTRIVSFSRFRKYEKSSFSFLGIEFRWGLNSHGKDDIKRRTDRKRLKRAIAEIAEWCKENRHQRIGKQAATIKAKLQGHYNYYGIAGNKESLKQFYEGVKRIWYKWLNRRSQRRSYTWKEYHKMLECHNIPTPKTTKKWQAYRQGQLCFT